MIGLRAAGDLLEQFPCLHPGQAPEIFGPTDVNAQSGNGGLSVAFNADGTVTVFRWPRPSFYDQVKYRTTDRDSERMGARPNEGAFLGVAVGADGGRTVSWLRDWETDQRYLQPTADAIETTHRSDDLGLTVTVRDVVAREADVLVRAVEVERDDDSPVEDASLIAFENMNLVVTKEPRNPVQDWCREYENTDAARYEDDADAIIHRKTGEDESTGEQVRVAVGMAVADGSDGHQVGGDAYEPDARDPNPGAEDAFDDADDGRLRCNDDFEGQTTGALRRSLDLDDGSDTTTVLFAAAETPDGVVGAIESARDWEPAAVRARKREWFEDLVGDAPMPAVDDPALRELCRRALVTLVTNYDPESGAIVASIATQSPYNLDWPRDGAYFNHVLDLLGLHDWVEKHNRWYADLQHTEGDPPPAGLDVPPGAWTMNYYADGVPGGPIPWEIDETAFAAWSLWDHYAVTGDREYLEDVYPAIRRTAELLVDHRDEDTGLHARAHEDDNMIRSQTIIGAGAVWLALDAAARAAEALDRPDDARRYRERGDELADAMEEHLWNESTGAYSHGFPDVERLADVPVLSWIVSALPLAPDAVAEPALAWPVGFRPLDDERMERHVERLWRDIAPTFDEPEAGEREFGLYDVKGLLSLAKAWRGDEDRMERVREGLRWVAHHHATDDTHVMGEIWRRREGEIITGVSQPHAWTQLLFYYACLEAFPPASLAGELEAGYHGAIERLRP